ncbi:hypothetical protein PInf_008522 [Phytophthora infestans]|nr:hypothetical protein PInf_008522 [Phytophthora infestans]
MKRSLPVFSLKLADLLPELSVSDADQEMLRDLASDLVTHNLEQSNTLMVTKKGYPESITGQWKEMRRKDGVRIFRERPGSDRGSAPFTPSLLLLGTVDGTVEDVMYGVVATTDAAMKINSTYVNDGMLDTKMLCELEEPSIEDPFYHVGIKWKLFSERDYVSLDTTGILRFSNGERCYVRGFFDFPTKGEMLNNVALQALASQWLSFGRKVECGRTKKLAWRLLKKVMCAMAPDGRTVQEKKRPFCRECVDDAAMSDTLAIARDELAFDQDDFQYSSEALKGFAAKSIPMPEPITRRRNYM